MIVGPRDKEELLYRRIVNEIIDACKQRYSKLVIVTKSCDQGVGKIIRSRCLKAKDVAGVIKYNWHNPEFDMIEVSLRHFLIDELPQSEFQSNFDALNKTLLELGDEFHLIVEDPPRGSMLDLLTIVKGVELPYAIYYPGELKNGPKQPDLDGGISGYSSPEGDKKP